VALWRGSSIDSSHSALSFGARAYCVKDQSSEASGIREEWGQHPSKPYVVETAVRSAPAATGTAQAVTIAVERAATQHSADIVRGVQGLSTINGIVGIAVLRFFHILSP
jgi:hypothetical protein